MSPTIFLAMFAIFGIDKVFSEFNVGEVHFRCLTECGFKQFQLEMWHGKFQCIHQDDINHYLIGPTCVIECLGSQPASNQTHCQCEACKAGHVPPSHFCRYPGCKAEEESCEAVCQGRLTYFGQYCDISSELLAKAENEYGISRRDTTTCWKKCGGKKPWFNDLWNGLHVCMHHPESDETDELELNSRCYAQCMGAKVDDDQTACLCQACKNVTGVLSMRTQYHKGFCEKPGVKASITVSDCDEFVCSGKYKYFGRFCELESQAELDKAEEEYGIQSKSCVERAGGRDQWYVELWKGQHVCAYIDDNVFMPVMGTDLYFQCEGIKTAKDQNQCKADFCNSQSLNYDKFCPNPGVDTFINKKDCDTLVLMGKVDYHGHFCKLMTKEELERADEKYGAPTAEE